MITRSGFLPLLALLAWGFQAPPATPAQTMDASLPGEAGLMQEASLTGDTGPEGDTRPMEEAAPMKEAALTGEAPMAGDAPRDTGEEGTALAEERAKLSYALVIGNEHYDNYPDFDGGALAARRMAAHLAASGYTLVTGGPVIDGTWPDVGYALMEFRAATRDGGIGVVYFAGHTYSREGDNFFLATDSAAPQSRKFHQTLIPVDTFWSFPRGREPGALLMVLETKGALGMLGEGIKGSGTGLLHFETPSNVIVALSDAAGAVTLWPQQSIEAPAEASLWQRLMGEPEGELLPFTAALIETSALTEGDAVARLKEAALRVAEVTAFVQQPALFATGRNAYDLRYFRREFETAARKLQETVPAIAGPGGRGTGRRPMDFTSDGLDLTSMIQMFEGFRAAPYLDIAGIPTIGYGHTTGVSLSQAPVTAAEAEGLLLIDLAKAEAAIDEHVTVRLNANQQMALTSFIYNVGTGAFGSSQALKMTNEGRFEEAAAEMLRWVHVRRSESERPSVEPGLLRRRELEAFLFITPVTPVSASEIIRTFEPLFTEMRDTGSGRLIGYGRRVDDIESAAFVPPASVDDALAREWLEDDVARLALQIAAAAKVPLSRGQMAALISYAHDVGFENFYRSPVFTRLTREDYVGVANALRFAEASPGKGLLRVDQGTISRRAAEASLFFASTNIELPRPLAALR
ncbi:MAG: glycoside hydrolase family protein [Parvibaculum sp.]